MRYAYTMTHYYFAYGRNTNSKFMMDRCPRAVCLGPAWLDGYAFRWRGVADLDMAPDDYVLGVLWELNDGDLAALDWYEGFPRKYFRQRVIAKTSTKEYTSWAYIMVNPGEESAPKDEYRTALFEGYAENDISCDQMELGFKRLNG